MSSLCSKSKKGSPSHNNAFTMLVANVPLGPHRGISRKRNQAVRFLIAIRYTTERSKYDEVISINEELINLKLR